MVEMKSVVIGECVTHDTVTAAGYAEQCGGAHIPYCGSHRTLGL